MSEPTANDLATMRDRFILDAAKLVTDVIGAAVATCAWASICSLVVIAIWHSDNSTLLAHGKGVYWLSMIFFVIITVVAVLTSAFGFLALWTIVEIVRKKIETTPNLLVAIPFAIISPFLGYSLILFAIMAVAVLTLPAATALGFITR